SEIESIWDSQIRAFLIHRAGWAGGQHGWASLTLTIFGSGWLRRSRLAGCPAIGRPNNSGLPSARPLDGCDGDERPAAWRRARWVVTGRRRFPANTAPGCYRGSSGTSLCAAWSSNLPSVDLRSITVRCGSSSMLRSSASKKSVVAGERDRPDVARRRARWIKYQDRVEPERLVFIDETWTRTDMAPLRGWAPRGCRLTTKVPHGRWKTMTFLAALRHDRIEAPWFIEGPIDG